MTMNNSIFQEIDSLHSQLSVMDNATRLGWLVGKRMQLEGLANQMAQYVQASGGFLNVAEKECACKLLAMIQAVDTEGAKTMNELRNEAIKELAKHLI